MRTLRRKLSSWAEYPSAIDWVELNRRKLQSKESGLSRCPSLFRGIGNADWRLETTLERSYPSENTNQCVSFLKYYEKSAAEKATFESLSATKLDELPSYPAFMKLVSEKSLWFDQMMKMETHRSIFEYWIYIRHHGYPSPLLDWTSSPYIAAFFAFDATPKGAQNVVVYSLVLSNMQSRSSSHHFFLVPPDIKTHKRHHLQRSWYSMCVGDSENDYEFITQADPFVGDATKNGRLLKIVIPVSERENALRSLDLMNINPFSLYGSEDSLVRTIARRQFLY